MNITVPSWRGGRVLLKFSGLMSKTQAVAILDGEADPLLAFPNEQHPDAGYAEGSSPRAARRILLIMAIAVLVTGGILGLPRLRAFASAGSRSAPREFGTLAVTSAHAGATVTIDGVPRGATPVQLSLTPGTHTLIVQQGSDQTTLPIPISAGENVARYFDFPSAPPLPPRAATLSVTVDHGAANVLVDGVPSGKTPLTLGNVRPGEHIVSIATDAGAIERRITIESGMTASVLFAVPAATVAAGWLTVKAPFDVQIYQDDDLVGSSATSKIMLSAGRHDLRLVNAALGYKDARKVEIATGKTTAIRIAAPNVAVSINARPWADVSVDGSSLGQTPLANVLLSVGQHQVAFRHPQLGERVQAVTITAAGPNRVSADLTQR